MRTETAIKRLREKGLITRKGRVHAYSQWAVGKLVDCKRGACRVHGKRWVKSCGRYTLDDTKYWQFYAVVTALGLKYNDGNDAPKWGKDGDFIEVPASEMRKIRNVEFPM